MNTAHENIELKDVLFDTTLALEEMIVYQEGKLPERVMDVQVSSGYHEARRRVLNDARSQLRRTKTGMIRLGVVRARAPDTPASEHTRGWTASTLEKGQDSPGQGDPPRIESQGPRTVRVADWFFALVVAGVFVAGFWWPWCHAGLAAAVAVCAAALPVYFRIVGVKAE